MTPASRNANGFSGLATLIALKIKSSIILARKAIKLIQFVAAAANEFRLCVGKCLMEEKTGGLCIIIARNNGLVLAVFVRGEKASIVKSLTTN